MIDFGSRLLAIEGFHDGHVGGIKLACEQALGGRSEGGGGKKTTNTRLLVLFHLDFFLFVIQFLC